MASEASGDSTTTETTTTSSSTTSTTKFRPSALSDAADKIWKKSNADTNPSSSATSTQPKLFDLSSISSRSGTTATTNSLFPSSSESSPFIFGKNISKRVANAEDESSTTVEKTKLESGNAKSDISSSEISTSDAANGKSSGGGGARVGVSFDTLAATSAADSSTDSTNGTTTTMSGGGATVTETTGSSVGEHSSAATALSASAAAYEAAKSQTQKQPQLLAPEEVKTGEEDEVNVVQATIKLYLFDTAKQSWTDRGLAVVRVNDRRVTGDEGMETRIVVRLQGSLRVIVNTKLWPDMLLERVSPKRLRLSGTIFEDSAQCVGAGEQGPAISIYLISAGQAVDVDRIERALQDRKARLKLNEQLQSASPTSSSSTAVSKKRPFSPTDEMVTSSSNDSKQSGATPAKKRELDQEQEGDGK